MGRRSLVLFVAVLALGLLAQGAAGLVPGGPRLAVSKLGPGSGAKLYTVGPEGKQRRTLLAAKARGLPVPWGKAAWAPDGSRLAIAGLTGRSLGKGGSYPTQIFLVPADGGKPAPLAGTREGSNPVFSPDGQTIAFARKRVVPRRDKRGEPVYRSISIWLLDLQNDTTRRITPWRNRLRQVPSSFSPDGAVLAFTRYAGSKRPEAIGINFDGSAASVLVYGSATEPVFSPDGTRIAVVRGNDLYTVRYGGGERQRLTKTPKSYESEPSWDPSGQRLAYYVAANPRPPVETGAVAMGGRVRSINADGTCETGLLGFPKATLYGPAWQPGPGRGAGPLSC